MKWRLMTCLILAFCIVLPSATLAASTSGTTEVTGTVPLVISDVTASNIGYYGATVSWKTNGDATSQVFYDTVSHDNTTDYAYHTAEDTDLVSEHSVRLTGLSAGTTYHYRVRSAIPDREFIAISEDFTFLTSSPTPPEEEEPPPPAPTIETDLFGEVASLPISEEGEIQETIEATSEDGVLTLAIEEGTIALDEEGEPLATLMAAVDESPPDPPEDAHLIGLVYDFGPEGATFDPPITLTWSYDPDALPDDVAEEDLVLAYYDEAIGEWVELDCVVDTENNTITASVAHFTAFAIIGTVTPPEEVPPEEEEEVPPVEEEEEVPPVLPVEEEGPPVEIEVVEEEVPPVEEEEEVVEEVVVEEEEVVEEVVVEEEEEEVPTKPGVDWRLIGGIIGGVIALALLIYLLLPIRMRRAS